MRRDGVRPVEPVLAAVLSVLQTGALANGSNPFSFWQVKPFSLGERELQQLVCLFPVPVGSTNQQRES